ncbi:hypothetical protein ACFY9A_38350 [Streptomyces rubradiris]|jgi:hypothetical protein|uniref:hypothetical protein n=1 Tax=Streptomyces rubradiris TaxID=285531 RepID=UPI0036E8BD42
MALADDIEFFGRAVAAGDMDRAAAVKALTEASHGGLTERGADDLITNWQTARSEYRDTFDRTRQAHNRLTGCDDE